MGSCHRSLPNHSLFAGNLLVPGTYPMQTEGMLCRSPVRRGVLLILLKDNLPINTPQYNMVNPCAAFLPSSPWHILHPKFILTHEEKKTTQENCPLVLLSNGLELSLCIPRVRKYKLITGYIFLPHLSLYIPIHRQL